MIISTTLNKNGSKLEFIVKDEFNDSNKYYYDFNGNKFLNEKGKEVSKNTVGNKIGNLKTLKEGIDNNNELNKKYVKFIEYASDFTGTENSSSKTNLASILSYFCLEEFKILEQLFLQDIQLVPESILKLDKLRGFKIKKDRIDFIKECLLESRLRIKLNHLLLINDDKNFYLLKKALEKEYIDKNNTEIGYFLNYFLDCEKIQELIEKYNYDPETLMDYVYNICINFEGYYKDEFTYDSYKSVKDLYDYIYMAHKIKNKSSIEKYPRFLKSKHDILTKNYNIFKRNDENKNKLFKLAQEKIEKYVYKDKEFSIIIPTDPKELIDEGISLSHCVGSYIDRVIDEKCNIVFMRKNDNLEESYITIEIKKNKITQAQGKYNRDFNYEENMFLEKFQKHIENIAC